MRYFAALSALVLLAAALAVACDDAKPSATEIGPSPEAAITFGSINRLPGGVATVTSDHVLESITCANDELVMVTSAGRFIGTMDCTARVPDETIDRFIGRPILITVSDTRLKIEHPEAGSLDFPATSVRPEVGQ